ncbi:DUF3131 domain-containing protein [Desulfovibrio sp. JC022]|uniref:DUF3131 domain-containing protein n=1 Tax=Desulfovibrio sp. JC022 TaxID=2593642 RepID=UPI0013D6F624|nr:DUF3131 domain-containing protein [Desulfovibrio sp. JC022]NDV24275.1 DUF3131 domain-containing protein [Desulfovibrio sp. JC022]
MFKPLRIIIFMLLILVASTVHTAYAAFDGLGQLVSSPTFAEAVVLYKNGKYDPSALLLDDLARNLRGISPEVSGLVFVMASRAAENAGNARAYESWGMATARFARAGMSWQQVRSTLDQQLEIARLGASGPAAVGAGQSPGFAGPAVNLPPEAGRLSTAWKLFGLKHYKRPAPGLRREMTADQIWNEMGGGAEAPVTVIPYSEGVWGQPQSSGKLNEQNIAQSPVARPIPSQNPSAPSHVNDVPHDHSSAAAAASYAASTQKKKPAVSEQYMQAARIAWKYFQRNYQPATGLYNGLDLYPVTTVWEIGTSLAALNAAHRLEIITDAEFRQRAGLMLQTLSSMDLYNNELPNKLYFADSARMVGEDQKPTSRGIGWNGPDIARLLLWIKKTAELHPEFKSVCDKIFQRLRTERLVNDGIINSLSVYLNKEQLQPETGFGLPSYAAEALKLWNLNAWKVRDYRPQLGFKKIYGIKVPFNKSGPAISSTPFTLILMELGRTDTEQDRMIRSIYEVQAARNKKNGKLTAADAGRIDRSPWVAQSVVITSGGKNEWQCISPYADKSLPLFWASTATGFCWDALFNTAYTRKLVQELSTLHAPEKGFMAGKYDNGKINKAVTLETNGLILEAAMYRRNQ